MLRDHLQRFPQKLTSTLGIVARVTRSYISIQRLAHLYHDGNIYQLLFFTHFE